MNQLWLSALVHRVPVTRPMTSSTPASEIDTGACDATVRAARPARRNDWTAGLASRTASSESASTGGAGGIVAVAEASSPAGFGSLVMWSMLSDSEIAENARVH